MKRVSIILLLTFVVFQCMYAKPPQTNQADLTTETQVLDYTYVESTARNLELSTSAINLPLVAEVQVIPKRISHVEKDAFKNILVTEVLQRYGANFKTEGIAEYKRIALARAANANNADLIVGATFEVETTEDNHLSIRVVGYPAVYKNFHTAKKEDADILKMMEPYMNKEYNDPVLNVVGEPIRTVTTEKVIGRE